MKANGALNVTFVNNAISDKVELLKLSLNSNASMNSISDDRQSFSGEDFGLVQATTIDEFCKEYNTRIDFIKADIEGAEMAMLRGAENTIKTYKPTLAICLYHKRNDYFEIPQIITEYNPDYKFYFRCEAEPVLFAK